MFICIQPILLTFDLINIIHKILCNHSWIVISSSYLQPKSSARKAATYIAWIECISPNNYEMTCTQDFGALSGPYF